jgi:hypothetical protein
LCFEARGGILYFLSSLHSANKISRKSKTLSYFVTHEFSNCGTFFRFCSEIGTFARIAHLIHTFVRDYFQSQM